MNLYKNTEFVRLFIGRVVIATGAVSSLAWAGALLTTWVPATAVLFTATFVPVGAMNVAFQAAIQSAVDESLLGRMTSVMSSASTAALPLASLLGGVFGSVLGPVATLWLSGIGFVLLAAYVFARPGLRSLPAVEDLDADSLGLGTPTARE